MPPPDDGNDWDVFSSQVLLVLALATALVLVAWPVAEAVRRRRVGWAVAILLVAPVGGLAWFLIGRGGNEQASDESAS